MKRLSVIALAAMLVVAMASAVSAAPADGNGNKFVVEFEESDIPIFCDEDEVPDLWLDVSGWFQGKEFGGKNNRNVELTVFHIDETYTNGDGDTWVWRDRGPDHLYFDKNGDLMIAVTGRSGVNNIGHVVINFETFEIELRAGRAPFGGELFENTSTDFACDTLT